MTFLIFLGIKYYLCVGVNMGDTRFILVHRSQWIDSCLALPWPSARACSIYFVLPCASGLTSNLHMQI